MTAYMELTKTHQSLFSDDEHNPLMHCTWLRYGRIIAMVVPIMVVIIIF